MLKGNITEYSVWAEGPGVTTDYDGSHEYLNYYDDGLACFGEKGHSVDGGFIYTDASTEYWFSEQSVATLKWDLGGVMSGAPSDLQNTELWGEDNLPFAPLAEVEQMLLDKFQKWDLTMQTMERYTVQLSQEQSCYLLMFTEQIGELPLMPYFYTKGYTKFNDWLLNCNVSAYVSEDGIINMSCMDLVQTGEKLDTVEILSLEEAKAALEEYMRSKGLEGICVEDMGLYYIGMPIKDQTGYQLTPFWFFCISSENPLSASDAETGSERKEVDYEFLNAIDGEWLQY